MADLSFICVKNARHTTSIPVLFALLKNKSAHFKLLRTKNNRIKDEIFCFEIAALLTQSKNENRKYRF
ncbi:MAG: hypothetical protein NC213_03320 [Acetobacter sp.]|nr:hypothetical protein [Bacteroides sp.]MCM1340753.1 hypothetical protein [Acetobacter sp.]MCM1433090.1 hypothetical protein [Clostridiales bacterium]